MNNLRTLLTAFAVILIGIGVYLYLQGKTVTAMGTNITDPIEGFYLAIVGLFMIISAILLLALQIFPRKKVL